MLVSGNNTYDHFTIFNKSHMPLHNWQNHFRLQLSACETDHQRGTDKVAQLSTPQHINIEGK